MASNPPGACCFKTVDHSGTSVGTLEELNGVNTYITGDRSSERVIIFLADVFGPVYINSQLLADSYAKNGYLVVIPDIYFGDYVPEAGLEPSEIQKYLHNHRLEVTQPIVDKAYEWVKTSTNAKFIGTLGFCFGAKYAVRLIGDKDVDAASIFHPSFVDIEEIAAIKKPLHISAAETDDIYPAELRRKTEDKLKEIGARYVQTLHSNTTHGFACRSDPSDKLAWLAQQKAFNDTLWFFENA